MAAKTRHDDTADGRIEIDAINRIRLERNWSYQQLADDMARAGSAVAAKTLQALINYRPKPYDRTLFQIQRYLEVVREREKHDGRKATAAR